jgi:hypothetical protein
MRWGWDEYTYYPGLGVIAVGRQMFPAMRWLRGQGVHYWEALIVGRWEDYGVMNRQLDLGNGAYSVRIQYVWPGSTRVSDWMTGGWRGYWTRGRYPREWYLLVPQLWRIQRAVRAFLARRRWMREARLVFALGMLSPQCRHACLPPEMVARVCAYVQ